MGEIHTNFQIAVSYGGAGGEGEEGGGYDWALATSLKEKKNLANAARC